MNQHILLYVRTALEIGSEVIVLENSHHLLDIPNAYLLDPAVDLLREAGYFVSVNNVNMVEHNISRHRVVVLCSISKKWCVNMPHADRCRLRAHAASLSRHDAYLLMTPFRSRASSR